MNQSREKHREYMREWRARHPGKGAAYGRKYYDTHREKSIAATRKWQDKHPEKVRESNKHYQKNHPEECAARKKKYAQSHRDSLTRAKLEWYRKHPGKNEEYQRRYYQTHKSQYAAQVRRRRAMKHGAVNLLSREDAEQITTTGCFFCGSRTKLTIAHDVAIVKGGNTTRGNVFCLCKACNSRMQTKALRDVLIQLSIFLVKP